MTQKWGDGMTIEQLKKRLSEIKGNDPMSRSRRSSLKARILELEAQAAEEAEA